MCFKTELEKKWDWFPENIQLLEKSKGLTTWDGRRVITVEGIKGTKSIDEFATKLMRVAKENEETGYLWEEDRERVIPMVQHARRLYTESDHLDTKTFASKVAAFFRSIRDFFSSSAIRQEIEGQKVIENLSDYSHKRQAVEDMF